MVRDEAAMKAAEALHALLRKPWNECTVDERLEKLRYTLRDVQRSLSYIARSANQAHELAEQHQHAANGDVMKPARNRNYGGEVQAAAPDILA